MAPVIQDPQIREYLDRVRTIHVEGLDAEPRPGNSERSLVSWSARS